MNSYCYVHLALPAVGYEVDLDMLNHKGTVLVYIIYY